MTPFRIASGEQHETAAESAISAYYGHIQGADSPDIERQAIEMLASLMTLAQANRHDFDLAYVLASAAKLASGIEYAY